MIRITALYPNGPDATFDFDYYTQKHLDLFQERFGPAGIRRIFVERGTWSFPPGTPAPYICVFHALVEDGGKAMAVLAEQAAELMADVPNFTNAPPVIQFGEIHHQQEIPAQGAARA